MKKNITIRSLSDSKACSENIELASKCPMCGIGLTPEVLFGVLLPYENDERNKVFLLNYCPSCEECFLSRHTPDEEDDGYLFESSYPDNFYEQKYSECVKKLSPKFVSIYNESFRAERLGMQNICGMGYRKSLEFLVKDYAVSLHPMEIDKIRNTPLSRCIDTYIDNAKIRALAKASAWLGNDETHYVRKHEEYGLHHLKAFISAIVSYIDLESYCAKAQELLSAPSPQTP